MAKSSGAQRESGGVVVPEAAQRGAVGRKGPDFGHASSGGKRKGMAGTTRPKSPRGHQPMDNVRKLQRRLYVAAKRSPGRRFHALFDRIWRGDVLQEAWRRVRANRGAAGVDRETLADVEGYGVERMLRDLQDALRAGDYRPPPVRRRDIPKPDGGVRPLGIPTVRDRVAQQAAKLVLELHPDKTRIVDLGEGREGFDFLGCHFHARVSGRLLERGIRRYYLHRWPSARSMKKMRQRVKELTGRSRNGVKDVRVLISELNPILRGWGNYFRTGNAAGKFRQMDWHVTGRLRRFLMRRQGRNLRTGQLEQWNEDWLNQQGLYRLRGTIRYPEAA